MRAGMRAGMRASLRSLRLREADRAPANAGARLRSGGMCGAAASRRPGSSYRSELVRRGCADRNPSRPPRWIAASLRHCAPRYGVSASPWSCAPLRRRSGIAPVPRTPPRRRFGLALEPPPPATAPRPRSGAVPPRRRIGIGLVPRPPRQRFDPALGATTFALTPRSGAVPPLGTTTLALGTTTLALASRPRFWVVFLPRCRDPRCPGGHDPRLGGCAMRKPSVLVAGGQNRRFFAVSEVRNGRFCRLFA